MADVRTQTHHLQTHPQHGRFDAVGKGIMHQDRGSGGPSASKIIAVMASLPVGGTLLALTGFTLLATLVGAAITTPLFIIFSPVLVPAAIAVGLAVTGFLTSGVFGITALSALSWVLSYIRQTRGTVPEQMDHAKRRMQDMAGYVGQKTKETGQQIQNKAHEGSGGGGGGGGRTTTTDVGHK